MVVTFILLNYINYPMVYANSSITFRKFGLIHNDPPYRHNSLIDYAKLIITYNTKDWNNTLKTAHTGEKRHKWPNEHGPPQNNSSGPYGITRESYVKRNFFKEPKLNKTNQNLNWINNIFVSIKRELLYKWLLTIVQRHEQWNKRKYLHNFSKL